MVLRERTVGRQRAIHRQAERIGKMHNIGIFRSSNWNGKKTREIDVTRWCAVSVFGFVSIAHARLEMLLFT
jgi:hypothetical protein